MEKYKLLRITLESQGFGANGTKLQPAPLARREEILAAHEEKFVDSFLTGKLSEENIRRIGFPWSLDLVYRTLSSVGGTLQAAIDAVSRGRVAGNLSGGTHHAHSDFGSGYCVFNDIAVAASVLLKRKLIQSRPGSVLVCDLDVHQGDGTASIFANDDRVRTLSLHGKNNFPFRKQQSTVDVEFDDGATDAEYLGQLRYHFHHLIKRNSPQVVFFQAGVDPLKGGSQRTSPGSVFLAGFFAADKLGKLAISRAGLRSRNKFVFQQCKDNSIPVGPAPD